MSVVTDLMEGIGDAIDGVFDFLEPAFEGIAKVVEAVISPMAQQFEYFIQNPLEAIVQAAAASVGIPPYVTSAAITAAKGGSLEDIAKSAALSYASTEFMSQTNIGADIKKFVGSAGGDFTDSMMKTFDLTPDQAVQLAKVSTAALNSSVMGGIKSALNGDSIAGGMASGFQSGLVYASTDSFFSAINKDQNWGLSPTALNLVKGATSTVLNTVISGKGDPAQALGSYIGGALINIGSSEFSKLAKSSYDDFTGKTALAQEAQAKYLNLENTYKEKLAASETLRTDIQGTIDGINAIKTAEIDPIVEQIRAAEVEQTAASTEYYAQKTKWDENKKILDNYNDEMINRGFSARDDYASGILEYYKIEGGDGETSGTRIDAPSVETFVQAQKDAALAANAAADKSNAAGKSIVTLSDSLKPIQDKIAPLQATLTSQTKDFNAIKDDIQTPTGNNLAAQLKTAADTYQTKYSDYAASKTAADKAAENSAKQIAAVASRNVVIDFLNSDVLKVTGKDANGTYTLSNGMMLDSSGKFFQDGVPAFGDAAGVPQTKMQFADGKGNLVDFNINAGRVMSPTDVTSTLSKWFNVTATPAEAQALVDKGIDPNNFQSALGKFTDDKAIEAYKGVTGTEPTAAQVSTIRNSGTDIMTAAQQAAVNGLDLPEGYVSPGDSLATQVSRGQAYAAARLAYGPKATFDWTDPKTGVTKQYTTENAEEQTARLDKALGDAQARINLMPASEIAGAGRGFFAGKPAGVENIYYGKKDDKVYIDNRTFDAMGNVTGGGIEVAPDEISTNIRATNVIAQLGATGSQAIGELLQSAANTVALTTGSSLDNATYNIGKAMVEWGKDRDSASVNAETTNIDNATKIAAKQNFWDASKTLGKAALDNPIGMLSMIGKEGIQDIPGLALGVVATAFLGPLGIPATVAVRAAIAAAMGGIEAFGAGGGEVYRDLIAKGIPEDVARDAALLNGTIHAAMAVPAEFIANKALFKTYMEGVTGGVKGYAAKYGSTIATGAVTEYLEALPQNLSTQLLTHGQVDIKAANAGALFEAMIGAGTVTAMAGPAAINDAVVIAKDLAGNNVTLKEFMSGTKQVDLATLDSSAVIGQTESGTSLTLGSITASGVDAGINTDELKSILPASLTNDSVVIATSADGTDITFGNLKSLETKNPSLTTSTILDDIYSMSPEEFKSTFTPSVLSGDAVLQTNVDRQAMAVGAGFPDFAAYQKYNGDSTLYTNTQNNTIATTAGFPDFSSFTQYNGDLTAYNAAKTATGAETTAATTTTGPKVKTAAELANEAKASEIMMMIISDKPNPNGYTLLDAQAALRGEITPTDKAIAERTGSTDAAAIETARVAKVAADKVISDKAAADKVISDKAAADKVIADKTAADKVISDKAAADKVIADKAAADKIAADKVIADKAIADAAKIVEDARLEAVRQQGIADAAKEAKRIADEAIAKAIADREAARLAKVAEDIAAAETAWATATAESKKQAEISTTAMNAAAVALTNAQTASTTLDGLVVDGKIKDEIAGITFPAGISVEQVSDSIAAAMSANPGLSATDVANSIKSYMEANPGLSATDVNTAITSASDTQALALKTAKDELAKSISDLSSGTTTSLDEVKASILALQKAGLTTEQVNSLVADGTASVTTNLKTAITAASAAQTTALDDAKTALEKSISDLSTKTTTDTTALAEAIADLKATGLTEAQVKALVDAGTSSVSDATKTAIDNAVVGLATAEDIKTAIAGITFPAGLTSTDVSDAISAYMTANPGLSLADVATKVSEITKDLPTTAGVTTAIGDALKGYATAKDIEKAIAGITFPAGLSKTDVSDAISAYMKDNPGLSLAQVATKVAEATAGLATTAGVETAISDALKGYATATDLTKAQEALEKSIADLSTGATNNFNALTKSISDLAAAGLTEAQVKALVEAGTTSVSTDLKAAISTASGTTITAIADAKTELATAISDLASKTTTDMTAVNKAITDLQAAGLTTAQVEALVSTGTTSLEGTLKTAIADAATAQNTALDDAKTALTKSIDDLSSKTTTDMAGVNAAIAALAAAGLTTDQVQKIVDTSSAGVTTDLKAAITAAGTAQTTALNDAKTALTQSITDLSNKTTTDTADLKQAIADLKAAGLTEAQVQALVNTGSANVSTDLKAAIAAASTEQTTALETARAGLAKSIADLSSGTTTGFETLTKSIADLKAAGLTEAQVKALVDAGTAGVTTDLKAAITAASEAATTQIAGVTADIQSKYDAMTEAQKAEVAARQAQGQSLQDSITSTAAATQTQITGLSADLQAKYAAMTAAQQTEVAARQAQGQSLQDSIAATAAATQAQITGLSADLQTKYDAMTAAQKAEVAARQAQGVSLEASIQATATATQAQITGLSADLQAKYDAMTAAQKAEVANREAQGTTLAEAIKTTAETTQTQITNTQTQFNTRVDQLVTQGQTQQAATDTALKELNAGVLAIQTEQQAAKDTAAAAATEAKRASAQTSSNAGLAAAMGILGGTVGAVGQIGSKTAAAPVIDDSIPAYKKIGFTSTGETAKYVSPLEQYLKQVMGDSYANPQQAAPVNQAPEQQPSSSWSYGQETNVDDMLASSTLPEMGNYQSSIYSSKKGGLVPPLMAAGGSTRYGKYAGGGLNTVNFQGKDRIDFRTGNAVTGPGDGQSDDIPAMLADGEFVFPADVVAALGNGSTKAGSDKLYDMMHSIRSHSRSTDPKKLPPPAKSPLDYLNKRSRR